MMLIRPGRTPCLRCIFPDPPAPGELPTCDTAGVLGSAAAMVASLQVTAAMRLLMGDNARAADLVTLDVWTNRFRVLDCSAGRRDDCPACGQRRFEFLQQPAGALSARLCGRDAVQIQGSGARDAAGSAARLTAVGKVEQNRYFIRCRLEDGIVLTLFPDGRAIIQGTGDMGRARSIYARYVGT
jgi:adenylyltransferase/sulfurtransferase